MKSCQSSADGLFFTLDVSVTLFYYYYFYHLLSCV